MKKKKITKKSESMHLRVPMGTQKALDEAAKAQRRPVSSLARNILEDYLCLNGYL